ncbi:hypothetical protein Holit_01094 [Hollandina sp. SP2]
MQFSLVIDKVTGQGEIPHKKCTGREDCLFLRKVTICHRFGEGFTRQGTWGLVFFKGTVHGIRVDVH